MAAILVLQQAEAGGLKVVAHCGKIRVYETLSQNKKESVLGL